VASPSDGEATPSSPLPISFLISSLLFPSLPFPFILSPYPFSTLRSPPSPFVFPSPHLPLSPAVIAPQIQSFLFDIVRVINFCMYVCMYVGGLGSALKSVSGVQGGARPPTDFWPSWYAWKHVWWQIHFFRAGALPAGRGVSGRIWSMAGLPSAESATVIGCGQAGRRA